jgi:hypothetical protein
MQMVERMGLAPWLSLGLLLLAEWALQLDWQPSTQVQNGRRQGKVSISVMKSAARQGKREYYALREASLLPFFATHIWTDANLRSSRRMKRPAAIHMSIQYSRCHGFFAATAFPVSYSIVTNRPVVNQNSARADLVVKERGAVLFLGTQIITKSRFRRDTLE